MSAKGGDRKRSLPPLQDLVPQVVRCMASGKTTCELAQLLAGVLPKVSYVSMVCAATPEMVLPGRQGAALQEVFNFIQPGPMALKPWQLQDTLAGEVWLRSTTQKPSTLYLERLSGPCMHHDAAFISGTYKTPVIIFVPLPCHQYVRPVLGSPATASTSAPGLRCGVCKMVCSVQPRPVGVMTVGVDPAAAYLPTELRGLELAAMRIAAQCGPQLATALPQLFRHVAVAAISPMLSLAVSPALQLLHLASDRITPGPTLLLPAIAAEVAAGGDCAAIRTSGAQLLQRSSSEPLFALRWSAGDGNDQLLHIQTPLWKSDAVAAAAVAAVASGGNDGSSGNGGSRNGNNSNGNLTGSGSRDGSTVVGSGGDGGHVPILNRDLHDSLLPRVRQLSAPAALQSEVMQVGCKRKGSLPPLPPPMQLYRGSGTSGVYNINSGGIGGSNSISGSDAAQGLEGLDGHQLGGPLKFIGTAAGRQRTLPLVTPPCAAPAHSGTPFAGAHAAVPLFPTQRSRGGPAPTNSAAHGTDGGVWQLTLGDGRPQDNVANPFAANPAAAVAVAAPPAAAELPSALLLSHFADELSWQQSEQQLQRQLSDMAVQRQQSVVVAAHCQLQQQLSKRAAQQQQTGVAGAHGESQRRLLETAELRQQSVAAQELQRHLLRIGQQHQQHPDAHALQGLQQQRSDPLALQGLQQQRLLSELMQRQHSDVLVSQDLQQQWQLSGVMQRQYSNVLVSQDLQQQRQLSGVMQRQHSNALVLQDLQQQRQLMGVMQRQQPDALALQQLQRQRQIPGVMQRQHPDALALQRLLDAAAIDAARGHQQSDESSPS